MNRTLLSTLLVAKLLLFVGVNRLDAEQLTEQPDRGDQATHHKYWPPKWIDPGQYQRFVAVGVGRDSESLQGVQAGYGFRGYIGEVPGSATLWVSYLRGDEQRVAAVRGDTVLFLCCGPRPLGAGVMFSGAIENRSDPPHSGYGGYLGAGVGVSSWTPKHWHFTVGLEHAFGLSSKSRNQLVLSTAYAF
jgi:hypothetical protein